MRLIDADELKETICDNVYPVTDFFNSRDYGMFWTGGIEKAINEAPTIDAVGVVRCKDCKHNWVTSYNHGVQDEPRCKFTNYKFGLDDYCSRGERRE